MSGVWKTARAWAAMGLPGLPATKRGINKLAAREGWPRRRRSGRGGGWAYPETALPEAARLALAARSAETGSPKAAPTPPAPPAPAPEAPAPSAERADAWGWAAYHRLPDVAKDEAERKAQALDLVAELVAQGRRKADARAYAAEAFGLDGVTGLRLWDRLVRGVPRQHWLPALIHRRRGRAAIAECDAQAWEVLKADYLRPSRPAFAACYERLRRVAADKGWAIPSASALRARLRREVPVPVLTLSRNGPEALKALYPAQRRSRSGFAAMEAVNADGHQFDVFVRWPDGTVGRPQGLFFQDLHSGKILAHRVGRTENADSVRLAFGDMVERWGIPEDIYLDNGRGFASKWLTGGTPTRFRFKVKAEEPAGLFTRMGCRVHWATPYSGQSKPIERAFRDLCEYVARHPAFEGAYTGRNPMEKPANYGARAIPLDQFLKVLGEELRHHNARPGRRGGCCAGRSFDATFAASYADAAVRYATDEQRRLWLLAAEGVAIRRGDATIHLFGNRYWSECLAPLMGGRAVVRFDPDRLHDGVHVYRADGGYVGHAPCLSDAGFADTTGAREHARARKHYLNALKAQEAAIRRMDAAGVAALGADAAAPAAPAGAVGKRVVRLATARAERPVTQAEMDEQLRRAVEAAGVPLKRNAAG